ncbi:unnamed protein product [Rhizoctonia solani]|uniref:Transmembrane protein n=1 Tax=Rhizoctonia solani TaxID=456999 RepID=A0A8H2XN77_9AGAM|nr:unnamed protein product [Rhizoctonia solani]
MLDDPKVHREYLPDGRAGPTHSRPPVIVVPLPTHSINSDAIRTRTPTRTSTLFEDVELGIYLRAESVKLGSNPPTPSSNIFSRRGSNGSVSLKVSGEPEGFFFSSSTWRTDIITFCSHTRLNSALENARITQIQARKSRRLPFLHEYLLVHFTTGSGQSFVVRIDRLGKVGSSIGEGGRLGGVASNTAIQEIGVYHIQDSQSDSDDAPWLARDGTWGSKPVATLVTRHPHMHLSHHLQTAAENSSRHPTLGDVSRLLEGVLLEMPTYHLTTANCYLMTRSSLLLLQTCYPHSFECYLGGALGEAVTPSFLAEPVWTGLIRWYLPFAMIFLLVYMCLLVITDYLISGHFAFSVELRAVYGLRLALHYGFDLPLPLGLLHTYMNSLEIAANTIVMNLSTQFLRVHDGNPDLVVQRPPFEVMFDSSWSALAAWWMVGCGIGLIVFVVAAVEYGGFAVFVLMFILCVWFNLKFGDSEVGIALAEDQEEVLDHSFHPPTNTEIG